MGRLLIDDRPIMFLPQLAKALGSCERAIVLQQIHWLCGQPNSGMWEGGHKWVWGSYPDWCRDYFTMWSPHTLKKVILKLEASKVLISAQLRAKQRDQTKFYRIDYEVLQSIVPDQVHSIVPDQVSSIGPDQVRSTEPDQVHSLYSTETSTENTADEMRPPSGRKGKKPPRNSPGAARRSYQPDDYPDI